MIFRHCWLPKLPKKTISSSELYEKITKKVIPIQHHNASDSPETTVSSSQLQLATINNK